MTTAAGTIGDIGERAVIDRIRAKVPPPADWVALGIGDDAAVLSPERNRAQVVTTDSLVEGVHFDRRYAPPAAIGHKALAVNLSDLAAMGAEPRAALLSLILPPRLAVADFDAMIDGLLAVAAQHGVCLVGGNVARSPGPLILDVTATGVVKPRRVLSRAGARPGDDIYVSGEIGAAAAGLASCRERPDEAAGTDGDEACRHRFLRPEPRTRLGQLLGRSRVVSACIDLSDGFGDGIRQLAAASGVGVIVEADRLPVPEAAREILARARGEWLEAAISGGEDYELLFTASPRRRRTLESALRHAQGLPCTRIGKVTRERGLVLRRDGAETAFPEGFAHFR